MRPPEGARSRSRTPPRVPSGQAVFHDWFAPALHVQSSTRVPLAVPLALMSRHSFDCCATTDPFAPVANFWFAEPLQPQMTSRVPLTVPPP